MKLKQLQLLGLYVLCAGISVAAPIPVDALGLARTVVVTTAGGYPINISNVGRGGGYAGSVAGTETILWCVDSQLDVNSGTNNYLANVVRVSDIGNPDYDGYVRYDGVTGSGTRKGNEWIVNLGSAYNVASARYQMAAWLVSQYTGMPNGPSADDARNRAIQRAIWRVMLNESWVFDPDVLTGDISTGSVSGSWIQDAVNFLSAGNYGNFFDNWAVVSGGVQVDGDFKFLGGKQTFLVQLQPVPEPHFYGLLAAGLIGLLYYHRRNRLPQAIR